MREDAILPLWLRSIDLTIFGFEDEDEEEEDEDVEEEEDEDSEEEDEEDSDEDEEDEDEEEEDSKKSKSKKGDKTAGLKSALAKERKARREASKEARRLQRELDQFKPPEEKDEKPGAKDDKNKTKADKTQKQLDEERQKGEKLAAKFATNAVDTALVKVAGEAKMPKFRDIDDALRLVNRDDIDVEQDEDDPSDIEVDDETVRDALKALAKKKPHLLLSKEEAAKAKTGSKFSGKKSSKTGTEEELKKKYPALSRR